MQIPCLHFARDSTYKCANITEKNFCDVQQFTRRDYHLRHQQLHGKTRYSFDEWKYYDILRDNNFNI